MEDGDVPKNPNEHFPGTQSESAGKADACQCCPRPEAYASASEGPDPVRAFQGFLGLEGKEIHQSKLGRSPEYVESTLGVMSVGFMLTHPDEAFVWRGPQKNGLIKQFLKDVYWGELDFLVVDTPTGTSDEHISILQCLRATGLGGAIIVTTPQQVSLIDVRKEVSFCKKVGVPVLGVVENMSGLCQPSNDFRFMKVTEAGEQRVVTEWVLQYMKEKAPEMLNLIALSEVFDSSPGGAAKMCPEMGGPFLG